MGRELFVPARILTVVKLLISTCPSTPKEPSFYTFVRGSFTAIVSTLVLTIVVKEL
jgi:hypothetical protein